MFEYQYPSNLSEKYMILVWTVPELIFIGFIATITLVVSLQTMNPISFAGTAAVALFTAHFDERSVVEHFCDLAKFLFSPRTWQYIPNAQLTVQTVLTVKKKSKKKNSNFITLVVVIILMAFMIVWMNTPANSDASATGPTVSPTASSVATASPSASADVSNEPSDATVITSQATITIGEQTITTGIGTEPNYTGNVTVSQGDAPLNEVETSAIKNSEYYIDSSMVDINTPGSYPVTITAKDSNGVQTTSTFIVNVVQE